MSTLPLAARKDGSFVAVTELPDWCWTPVGEGYVLVPYPLIAFLSDEEAPSPDVYFNRQPAVMLDHSYVRKVYGDEAGTGGGVMTGVNEGTVLPDTASSSVFVNGKRLVRHGDKVWMNGN